MSENREFKRPNTDAMAWAEYFIEVNPPLDLDCIHGWFANAMMDMCDAISPAGHAAAHPKCGTCEYVREFMDDGEPLWHDCTNRKSRCWAEEVNPLTDYCPHHSERAK